MRLFIFFSGLCFLGATAKTPEQGVADTGKHAHGYTDTGNTITRNLHSRLPVVKYVTPESPSHQQMKTMGTLFKDHQARMAIIEQVIANSPNLSTGDTGNTITMNPHTQPDPGDTLFEYDHTTNTFLPRVDHLSETTGNTITIGGHPYVYSP